MAQIDSGRQVASWIIIQNENGNYSALPTKSVFVRQLENTAIFFDWSPIPFKQFVTETWVPVKAAQG